MPQPWETDRPLSESDIARRISERCPELSGARVAFFHEGWDSRAFLVEGKRVFRFSRHDDCDGDAHYGVESGKPRHLPSAEQAQRLLNRAE
jgi:hypothetical protein